MIMGKKSAGSYHVVHIRYTGNYRLNLKTSIFRASETLKCSFHHQRPLNFSANILRVKSCNMTLEGQFTKMTSYGVMLYIIQIKI